MQSHTPGVVDNPIPPHVPAELIVDFDYVNDPELRSDPHGAYMRLAGKPDLVYTPRQGGHWIATGHEVIGDIYQCPDLFSNFPRIIPRTVSFHKPQPFSDLNPPEHGKYRRLLNAALNRKAVQRFEQQAQDITIELTDAILPQGECEFATDIAQKLPVFIIMRWLDLPEVDRLMLMENTDILLGDPDPVRRKAAKQDTEDYVDAIVRERRARPGEDFISVLATGQVDDRQVTQDEARAMVANLVHGGLDTVRNMMSFIMMFLARNDSHRHAIAGDPESIPQAIDELLRWAPIPNMARSVTSDAHFRGTELKAGDMVLLPLVLSGRDERAYPDAGTVDFHRGRVRHLTFGTGHHLCPGMHLAQIELQILLKEWFSRIPEFRIKLGCEPVTRGGVILAVRSLQLEWDV